MVSNSRYKLKGDTSTENMDAWGHEYVRHLAGEIVAEWNDLTTESADGKSMQSCNIAC